MKVLIVLDNLHIGGISRSLLNLLPQLSGMAECDLLVFHRKGLEAVPESVHVLQGDDRLHMLGMSQREILAYSLPMAIGRGFMVLVSRLLGGDCARRLLLRKLPKLSGYDVAISFSQDTCYKSISTGCNHYVLEQVDAKKKVAFIHCDYESFGGYDPRQEKTYGRFDRVVCVSEGCRASFLRKFPKLEKTTVVCENFTDGDRVRALAQNEPVEYGADKLNIVTVCRLGEEKGLLRAAQAMNALVRSGKTAFCWTVVGDGPEKARLLQYINDNGLQAQVRLVGGTDNPYRYMAKADVFLLPSFHEAAPMVFGECQALGLPILATQTISAEELVTCRQLGTVCPNSTEGIEQALRQLLEGEEKPKHLPAAVMQKLNDSAHRQLRQLLGDLEWKNEEV